MFADEPTGNLDSTTSGEILALLRDSVDTLGQTTVMVTHDAHAAAIADRVLFLADGDIVRDLGRSTRARDPRDARGGDRAMIGGRAEGPRGPQGPRAAHRARRRHRRRDGQRHVHPHRHDAEVVQRPLHRVVRQDRRRHPRQGDRQELHQRQRRHDSRVAARRRSGRCPRSRRPAATSARSEANVADIIGQRRQGRRQGERRRQLRRRQRALQPAQAQDRQGRRRAPARSRSTPAPPTKQHYKVGDTVVVSTLGKQAHATRITGTVSFGERRLARLRQHRRLGRPDRPDAAGPRGPLRRISVAAKDGTSPAQLVRRSSRCCPRDLRGQGQRKQQAKDRRQGPQRRR